MEPVLFADPIIDDSDDLIESMCVRFDHCHGHTAFGESEAAWRRRQAHNRRVHGELGKRCVKCGGGHVLRDCKALNLLSLNSTHTYHKPPSTNGQSSQ